MIAIRPAEARGTTELDWLKSRHTFSFGGYYDPDHMGFRALRVINDDWIEPGTGFGTHPHRNMEIISYVLEGALAHRDSMGHGSVIPAGEFQRITAGRGVLHSEHNAASGQATHFLQIWIEPEQLGLPPSYQQRAFAPEDQQGRWLLVASRDGRHDSLTVHQDVDLYVADLAGGEALEFEPHPGRHLWLHVVSGSIRLADQQLEGGAGAASSDEPRVELVAAADSRVLLFDLA